jgi:glycerol-3-phosphate dehydrogenase
VTALACRDSGYIQRIAPHLLFRIPFLMPFASSREGVTLRDRAAWYATEVYVGTYDLYQPLKRGKPSTRLSAEELYRLEPALRPGLAGAVTLDEWGIDAFRLCTLNALDARARGADVRTWTEAREVLRRDGRVRGVRLRDVLTGEESEVEAPVVFNATGAWSPALARRSGAAVPMRPGKGVHLTLDRRLSNYGVICSAVDGRQMFVMPHENESIVGTTHHD